MRSLALVAAAALAGCATPYSEISGERYFQAQIDTYDLVVVSVDGKAPLQAPALVAPGRHEFKVRAAPTVVQHAGTTQTFTLDVQPCTRYYLVAVKPTRLQTDYTVKVDHERPVLGCAPTS